MDNIIKSITIKQILELWDDGGEVTLNDLCCTKIKEILKDYPEYEISVRNTIAKYTVPDGIIYKNGIFQTMLEFKKSNCPSIVKGALCQMFCYIYRACKNSIVPFRYLVIWNPKYIYVFEWEKIELLYENFKIQYKNETPSKYWDEAPKELKNMFTDIKDLATIINIDDLDFVDFIEKITYNGNYIRRMS